MRCGPFSAAAVSPAMVSLRSLTPDLQAETERIRAVRTIRAAVVEGVEAKAELKRMTSLASVSDRIRAKKESYAKKAEEWGARLDEIDRREPEAFRATEAALVSHETDLSDLEADMRALTNGPPTLPKS